MHHLTLEKIEQEAFHLNPKEQLQLIEKLIRELKQKTAVGQSLDWKTLYGLGRGLWKNQDAQDYVNQLREDRDASC